MEATVTISRKDLERMVIEGLKQKGVIAQSVTFNIGLVDPQMCSIKDVTDATFTTNIGND